MPSVLSSTSDTPRPVERSSALARAATLRQRLAFGPPTEPPATLPEPARLRLDAWREKTPFQDPEWFRRRLRAGGLDETTLLALLSESPDDLRQRLPASELPTLPATAETTEDTLGEFGLEPHERGLLTLAEPTLTAARERLRSDLERLRHRHPPRAARLLEDPDAVVALCVQGLPQRLLAMSYRSLILELHIATLEEKLQGSTPEERFEDFVRRLRHADQRQRILETYPVLARQLEERLRQWRDACREMFRRLLEDWPAIRRSLDGPQVPAPLREMRLGLGDRHRGGRSTSILTFTDDFGLVYKPRSLAVDVAFRSLLDWLETRGDLLDLRTPKVVDQGTHGWMELVAARECPDGTAVERFYTRQGQFLALLHVLCANDFHYENLIAAGEHPVPVDLETVFQPLLAGIETEGDLRVDFLTPQTVLRVGLLPRPLSITGDGPAVDVSGLAATTGPSLSAPQPDIAEPGTDRMRVVMRAKTMPRGLNRPNLDGEDVAAAGYLPQIHRGFRSAYQLLSRHRRELLAPGGPLEAFDDVPVRILVRPTEVYSRLIHASYHPDFLQDGLDQDRLFDRLWAQVPLQPSLEALVSGEVEALHRGDIPYFCTRPHSRDLLGDAEATGFFSASGTDLVRRRIEALGEDDMERQSWVIDAAFEAATPAMALVDPVGLATEAPASRDSLLKITADIARQLRRLALHEGAKISWLQVDRRGGTAQVASVGIDLYRGLAGIALFLGAQGALAHDEDSAELARQVWNRLDRTLEQADLSDLSVGAFDGWSGLLYSQLHRAAWQGEERCHGALEALLDGLATALPDDRNFEIIAGSAGALAVLLAAHDVLADARLRRRSLDLAELCGHHLERHAEPQDVGVAWPFPGANGPLCGFSHGAAGIAWALARLAAITEQPRYLEIARRALEFETTHFRPDQGNWRDLRTEAGTRDVVAWCHGAAGIGLARLDTLGLLGTRQVRLDITAALETTLDRGLGFSHCLCHGDCGNLELIEKAAAVLGDTDLADHHQRLLGGLLRQMEDDGIRCGNGHGVDQPGLMTGLAGIGYQFLRWAHPGRLPSVLLLEPSALTAARTPPAA